MTANTKLNYSSYFIYSIVVLSQTSFPHFAEKNYIKVQPFIEICGNINEIQYTRQKQFLNVMSLKVNIVLTTFILLHSLDFLRQSFLYFL